MRPLPTHEAPRREDGFTILELVIGMILLGLAIGVVGQVVIQAVGGGAGARAGAVSDGAISRTASMLADDVAAANTEHRRDNLLRDPADLAAALQRNEVAYSSDPSQPGLRLDIDEIARATPSELQLRADVDRRAGVECVTWRAEGGGGGFRLRRLVGPSCGGGGISDRVMLESTNAAAAGIDTTPFSYRLVCSRSDCPNTGAPSGPECQPWIVTGAVPTQRLRWVVGVDARLGVVSEGAAASGKGSLRIAVRSRDTQTYRQGLGC